MNEPLDAESAPLPRALLRRYRYHAARRSWSNFALLHHRACHGFVASMHQSGTHWLKFMLANALAARYALPPPRYNHANDFIGGPRDPIQYPQLPRILSSHSIPDALLASGFVAACVRLPRYVVLVRDIRAALVSNYEKWKDRYHLDFRSFLAGDPSGRRFNSDLWWCLRFMNGWGHYMTRHPGGALLVRYEDLRRDPRAGLRRVVDFLRLDIAAAHVAAAVDAASKEAMGERHDPARESGEVRSDDRALDYWFTGAETAFLRGACAALLRYGCGYDYEPESLPRLS